MYQFQPDACTYYNVCAQTINSNLQVYICTAVL